MVAATSPASAARDVRVAVHFLLSMQTQLRVYHWRTASFARHKAADDLLDRVVELSDRFVETLMGARGGVRPTGLPPITVVDLADANALDYLSRCVDFLKSDGASLCRGDSALTNVLDELVGAVDRAAYLFTLA
jgi:hypothetical protein